MKITASFVIYAETCTVSLGKDESLIWIHYESELFFSVWAVAFFKPYVCCSPEDVLFAQGLFSSFFLLKINMLMSVDITMIHSPFRMTIRTSVSVKIDLQCIHDFLSSVKYKKKSLCSFVHTIKVIGVQCYFRPQWLSIVWAKTVIQTITWGWVNDNIIFIEF